MFGKHKTIEFVNEEKLFANGPSMVQVTDFLRRVTYLPIEKCKTFLGLKQSIKQYSLIDADFAIGDCILHSGHNTEELDDRQWPGLLRAARSVFVYVRLSRKQADLPPPPLNVEAPAPTRLIEYAGLSSDESKDDRDRMTVAVAQVGRGGTVPIAAGHDTDLARNVEETKERLQSQGYVVNNVKSLERNIEKPRVFLRPSKAESSRLEYSEATALRAAARKHS
ncbi:uncharacterized protein BDZ99DRAFT_526729 [Mytilinidion resinicola]|uniref:Uncharacterized protein n=1 Tax=Mytilinidion resinicola TaxID=574789 RepID=A0A6A6Y569_9PEZI|nr:uncharacterized protein BDZ99DRAFT_526729 [Mytilinidion resinicola]KAF2803375.1 hypothetical protein BDZ99DRAFT_526729 [Mytilinidion resinicola]